MRADLSRAQNCVPSWAVAVAHACGLIVGLVGVEIANCPHELGGPILCIVLPELGQLGQKGTVS